MSIGDYIRQAVIFVLGVLLLVYDVLSSPPHDWVVLSLGLALIGVIPIEYVIKARNGHGPGSSGSSSSSSSGTA